MSIQDEEISSLKPGDVVYECERGMNLEVRIETAPTESADSDGRRKWQWMATNTQNGERIYYLLTEGLSHYGPRLYREPQYARIKDGEMTFPLLGAPEAP